jgi:hypothetical protein
MQGYYNGHEEPPEGDAPMTARSLPSPVYRGYLIKQSPFSPEMWIEKDGHIIHRVPEHLDRGGEAWEYARDTIDKLMTDRFMRGDFPGSR